MYYKYIVVKIKLCDLLLLTLRVILVHNMCVTLAFQQSSYWCCWWPYGAARASQLRSYCMFLSNAIVLRSRRSYRNKWRCLWFLRRCIRHYTAHISTSYRTQQNRLEDAASMWRGFYIDFWNRSNVNVVLIQTYFKSTLLKL